MEGRTVLLVTHNIVLAEQISDFVVVLGLDGKVASQGSMSDALKSDSRLRTQAKKQNKEVTDVKEMPPEKDNQATGKLIVAEELESGHLSWKAGSSVVALFGKTINTGHS